MRYPLKNWPRIKRGYRFGEKTFYSRRHLGTDFLVPEGTPVYAPADCEVVKTGNFPEGGKTIHVKLSDKRYGIVILRFMHLKKYSRIGRYRRGAILGYTGNTGKLTRGPHFHLDISRKKVQIKDFGNFIDPEKFFARKRRSRKK